jgi:hypothetical protein
MPDTHYPRSWKKFVERSRELGHHPAINPSPSNFPILSQWSARFRFAKSFKGLDLGEAYKTEDTPLGYASIMRIFLVYSAFETYCKALNCQAGDEKQVRFLQDNLAKEMTLLEIRKADPDNNLFLFLASHLNRCNTQIMNSFIEGGSSDINISFLAKSIRHVFAHGVLTGNAGGLSAKRFEKIAKLISDFLLECMDDDFERRVASDHFITTQGHSK